MKEVSQAYKTAMAKPIREAMKVEVQVGNYNPEGIKNITLFSQDSKESWSYYYWLNRVDRSVDSDIACLELNHVFLDTDEFFRESTNPPQTSDFFVTRKMNGSTTFKIRVTGDFSAPGLTVWFDVVSDEWPTHFQMQRPTRNGTKYYQIYPKGPKVYIPFDDYTDDEMDRNVLQGDIILSNFDMSGTRGGPDAGYRLRVGRVVVGGYEVFKSGDIISVDEISDVDPLSRRLPVQTLDFEIVDFKDEYSFGRPESLWPRLVPNPTVKIKYIMTNVTGSDSEEVQGGMYVLDGEPKHASGMTFFHCSSVLKAMNRVQYYQEYPPTSSTRGKSLGSKARGIASDAYNFANVTREGDIVIPASLDSITTYDQLSLCSFAEALQISANAGCCSLSSKRGAIVMRDLDITKPAADAFHIPFDQTMKDGVVLRRSPALKSIKVFYSRDMIDRSGGNKIIYKSDPLKRSTLQIEVGSYSGVSIDSSSQATGGNMAHYRNLIMIRFPESQLGKTFQLSGSNPFRLVKSSVDDSDIAPNGSDESCDNPLVANQDSATRVMGVLKKYYALRDTYAVDYRGNPEIECGDRIWVDVREGKKVPCLVLRTEIHYNGAIRGKLILKSLN